MNKDRIKIITEDKNIIEFEVEIPETNKEYYTGLANRDYIPENTGMLYKYNYPEEASMFTPETKVSVDFIFIDNGGNIIKIHHSAKPLSRDMIRCNSVEYVLEIAGGICEKNNLQVGDIMLFSNKDENELFILPDEIQGRFYLIGKNIFCKTENEEIYLYSYKANKWQKIDEDIKWKFFEQERYSKKYSARKYYISREEAKELTKKYSKEFAKDLRTYGKKYYQMNKLLFIEYDIEKGKFKYYSFLKGWQDFTTHNHKITFDLIKWYSKHLIKEEVEKEINIRKDLSKKKDFLEIDIINKRHLHNIQRLMYPYCKVFYKRDKNEIGWNAALLPGSQEYNEIYCLKQKLKGYIEDFIVFGGSYCAWEYRINWHADFSAFDTHMTSHWLYDTESNKYFILPDENLPTPEIEYKKIRKIDFSIEAEDYDEDGYNGEDCSLAIDYEIKAGTKKYKGCIDILSEEKNLAKFVEKINAEKYYAQYIIDEFRYAKIFAWKFDDKYKFLLQDWNESNVSNELNFLVDKEILKDFLNRFQKALTDVKKDYLTRSK